MASLFLHLQPLPPNIKWAHGPLAGRPFRREAERKFERHAGQLSCVVRSNPANQLCAAANFPLGDPCHQTNQTRAFGGFPRSSPQLVIWIGGLGTSSPTRTHHHRSFQSPNACARSIPDIITSSIFFEGSPFFIFFHRKSSRITGSDLGAAWLALARLG